LNSSTAISLRKQVEDFLHMRTPVKAGDKVLVAFSGGMDSVALLEIMHLNQWNPSATHVNFGLRGEESLTDAQFCRAFCEARNIPYFEKTVTPEEFKPGISVQMNARHIRYAWFEILRQTHNFDWILTAHHQDDQAETLVMQLLRRKNFEWFKSIPHMNVYLIRPLLDNSRKEIYTFVQEHSIPYREDSSNAEDVYLRNKIRHHIIPVMKEIQPSLIAHFEERMRLYNAQVSFAEMYIQEKLQGLLQVEGNTDCLDIEQLKQVMGVHAPAALHYLLGKWGENFAVTTQVIALLDSMPGKKVAGLSAWYFKDRQHIRRVRDYVPQGREEETVLLPEVRTLQWKDFVLEISRLRNSKNIPPPDDPWILYMDADRLKWPLRIRVWNEGDKMKPLGLKGNKKVSDILTDMKMPSDKKQSAFVILSGDEIIYVQSYRIANRVRINPRTRSVVQIQIAHTNA